MPTRFVLACLFVAISSASLYAQEPIYASFDVDSAASLRGGAGMLETFLLANVRKPFMAQVANVTGKVFVKGIIEPSGHVSDVTLVRGLRPDCDREALRVMRLFNAWKPALKGGVVVRQAVTYPVTFRANEPVIYENGQHIEYFDKADQPTTDKQAAILEQRIPVDSVTGLPTGDLVLSKLRGGKLKEMVRLPLERTERRPTTAGLPVTYIIGYRQPDGKLYGPVYTIDVDGNLRRFESATEETAYDERGMVTSTRNKQGNVTDLAWYNTGLLRQIEKLDKITPQGSGIRSFRLISYWDSTGRQQVTNGNGQLSQYSMTTSRKTTGQKVQFVEVGNYTDGLKDGIWKGSYADGSYNYEEAFDHGKPLGGTAVLNGTQKITYLDIEQNPEYKGGTPEMYRFLGQNVRYPSDAARSGIQGKVFISFTVCQDGTLCDYEVLKGVHPSIDQEALRVIQKMNGQWLPGYQRGEAVRVKYNMPVSFQLH